MALRSRLPWRKVEPGFWWCPDVGSATKRPDGWYASGSGYKDVILSPCAGPFRSAELAIEAFETQRDRSLRRAHRA